MTEASFAAALLNPDLAAPEGLTPSSFDIYRNSVTAGLIGSLEMGFPVIRQLVGAAYFTAMAKEFLRAHPPRDLRMMLYGGDLPGFLADFPPLADYPYLADVAALEQGLREIYHAADATPLVQPQIPLDCRLTLAPALRLICSAWPIHAIWRFHQDGGPKPVHRAEDVVILRPDYDPKPHLLPLEGGAFLTAVLQGSSVRQACTPLSADFPLQSVLSLLAENGAIVGISAPFPP